MLLQRCSQLFPSSQVPIEIKTSSANCSFQPSKKVEKKVDDVLTFANEGTLRVQAGKISCANSSAQQAFIYIFTAYAIGLKSESGFTTTRKATLSVHANSSCVTIMGIVNTFIDI